MNKEIKQLLDEMERWNDQDKARFNGGQVDFDGTFVFEARKQKIQLLRKAVNLSNENHS
jgi:hypothetical protein